MSQITGARVARLQELIGAKKTRGSPPNYQMQNKCPEAYAALKVGQEVSHQTITCPGVPRNRYQDPHRPSLPFQL